MPIIPTTLLLAYAPISDDFRHLLYDVSDDEKKQLFSEAEREVLLASGAESSSYWGAEVSFGRRTMDWRNVLDVFGDGSLDMSSRLGEAFVRCVRD